MSFKKTMIVLATIAISGGILFAQAARIEVEPNTIDIQLSQSTADVRVTLTLVSRDGQAFKALKDLPVDLGLTNKIGDFRDERGSALERAVIKRGESTATVFFRPGSRTGKANLLFTPTERVLFGAKALVVLY
jgi:hypothetical protein